MTTDLEKQFFDTFGIQPSYRYNCEIRDTIEPDDEFLLPVCSASEVIIFCTNKEYYNYCRVVGVKKYYPQITSDILLELICIAMQTYNELAIYRVHTVNAIKEKTLKLLIRAQDDVYSQVQALFKE